MDPDVLAALKKNEEMKNLLANKSGRTGASPLSKPQSQTHPSGNTESSLDVSHMSVHSPGKTLMAADVESDTVIQLKGTIENLIKDLGRALLEKQRCEAEIDSLRKKENMLKTALQLRTNSESAAVADAEHARNELQVVLEDRYKVDQAFKAQVEKQQAGVAELRKTFLEEMEKMESLKQKELLELEKSYNTTLRDTQKRMTDSREAEASATMRAERAESELEAMKSNMQKQGNELLSMNTEMGEALAARNASLAAKNKEIESLTLQLQAEASRWDARYQEKDKALRDSDARNSDLESQLRNKERDLRVLQRDMSEGQSRVAEVHNKMSSAEASAASARIEKDAALASLAQAESERERLTMQLGLMHAQQGERVQGLSSMLESATRQCAVEKERADALQGKLGQLEAQVSQLGSESDRTKQLAEMLEKSAANFRAERQRAEELEAKTQMLKAELDRAGRGTREVGREGEIIAELQRKVEAGGREINILAKELAAAKATSQVQSDEVDKIKADAKKAESQALESMAELAGVKAQLAQALSKESAGASRANDAEKALVEAKQYVESLKDSESSDTYQLKMQNNELSAQVEGMRLELAASAQRLVQQAKRLRELDPGTNEIDPASFSAGSARLLREKDEEIATLKRQVAQASAAAASAPSLSQASNVPRLYSTNGPPRPQTGTLGPLPGVEASTVEIAAAASASTQPASITPRSQSLKQLREANVGKSPTTSPRKAHSITASTPPRPPSQRGTPRDLLPPGVAAMASGSGLEVTVNGGRFMPEACIKVPTKVVAVVSGAKQATWATQPSLDSGGGGGVVAEWRQTLQFAVVDVSKDFAVVQLQNEAAAEPLVGLVALPVKRIFESGEEHKWYELLDRWGHNVHDEKGRISMLHLSFTAKQPTVQTHVVEGGSAPVPQDRQTLIMSEQPAPTSARRTIADDFSGNTTAYTLIVKGARNIKLEPGESPFESFVVVTRPGAGVMRTATADASQFPIFGEVLSIPIPQPGCASLTIQLFKANKQGIPRVLGTVLLSDQVMMSLVDKEAWVGVDGGHGGSMATSTSLLLSIRSDIEQGQFTKFMFPADKNVQDMVLPPMTLAPVADDRQQSLPAEDDILVELERTIGVGLAAVDGSVAVWSIAVFDGFILTGGQDGKIKVWSQQGQLARVMERHQGAVLSLCVAGRNLFSSSSDSEVLKWSLETFQVAAVFHGHTETVGVLTETLPGLIASGSADDKVLLWDGNSNGTATADGSPPICQNKYTLVGHTDSVLCLAFSAASKLLFSGSNDATVRVWSADTRWSCIQVLSGHMGPVLALGSLDQTGMVFSCSDDRHIRVWKKQTWEIVKEVPDGHASAINNTIVTRRNRFITFDDATACVWSVDQLSPLRHVDLRGEICSAMMGGATTPTIYSGNFDGTVRCWK